MFTMKTQLLEIDLSRPLTPITVQEGYDHYRILVRFHKRPIGWLAITQVSNGTISTTQVQQALKKSLLSDVVQQSLAANLGFYNNELAAGTPISVIVCTRNRTRQLAKCLEALLALEYPNYEIIIVDNAPGNEETYELVASLPVRYIREDRPGLDWARNRGIAEARHSIVAFTDDDVRVDRYWLQAIDKAFVNKAVMGVTGYVAPAELETDAQHVFEFSYGGMGHGFQRRVLQKDYLSDRQLLWASSFGVGANMAFRCTVFNKIGLFDVALDVGTPSSGGGDIELFHRLVADGYTLVYEPSVLVWHQHRPTEAALRKQIADNGKSFGCYMITCFKRRSVKRSAILQFLLVNWWYKWNLKNLIKAPKNLPRSLSLVEFMGILKSPAAYRASQKKARQIAGNIPSLNAVPPAVQSKF